MKIEYNGREFNLNDYCLNELTGDQVKEIRIWQEALRGGEYGQTTGALKKSDRYCCLGIYSKLKGCLMEPEDYCARFVLDSKIARKLGIKEENNNGRYDGDTFVGNATLPDPKWLREQTGISTLLWHLNDSLRWSFYDIADFLDKVIEARYKAP